MQLQNNQDNKDGDNESSISLLILSAKKGDSVAFEKLYMTLYTPLYRYVFSRSNDKELTEDICQQAFLAFYENLFSYEHQKSPLAYLFTVSKRKLINHSEKITSISFDETLEETVASSQESALDEAHLKALSEKINSFLPSLTEDEQEVIRLFFYSELSYSEIAAILDKEESSVRKIKERGLKKLRILSHKLSDGAFLL